jgi:4-amino-4-deoxy-L-arabinose transferase-like glycosyltransferase
MGLAGLDKFASASSERLKARPFPVVLFIFLLAVSIFRIYYIQNGPLDLSPDEAHYWEWSRRLDLSYYSKGPMIAYLIRIGTLLFGDNILGVRSMAVIFSALSSVFLYFLGKRLYDGRVGISCAILLQIIPLFSAFGVLFTIDSPFIFFWILSLFLFRKAIDGQSRTSNLRSNAYWLLVGISVGLGLLTKYTMAFFYLCAFLFLLFSREHRRLLLTAVPYISFIVSLLTFSPVIIWNASHGWVTLKHTAGQAHVAEGLHISLMSFLEFFGSQLFVVTPLLFVLMAVSLWKLRKEREGSFLYWFSIPVIIFFLLKSVQAKVQANWAMPGYLTGIIAFSFFYMKGFSPRRWGRRILVGATILLSLFITSAAYYSSILSIPVSLDPTTRLKGWEDLGDEVTAVYEQMSLGKKPVFLFSDRYQVSSELAFYVKGHPVTYCVNLDRRMNQYDLWPGFDNLLHYDAIFVRTGHGKVPQKIAAAFRKVEKKVFTAYTKNHIEIRDYSIFLCYDFKGLKQEKPESY